MNILKELKFNLIGEYFLNYAGEVNIKSYVDKVSERKRLVYLFAVENKVMYVGSTKSGFKRPLRYHSNINKQHKLRKVHYGIKEVLNSGEKVHIYVEYLKILRLNLKAYL